MTEHISPGHHLVAGAICRTTPKNKTRVRNKLLWILGSLELMRQSLQIAPTFVAVKQTAWTYIADNETLA